MNADQTVMEYGTTTQNLKPLPEFLRPDPRWESEHVLWAKSAQFTVEDLHSRLKFSELTGSVPADICRQFETARNLMLYSWFVFEFQTVAEMQAYGALELALRRRFENPTRNVQTKKGVKVVPLMLSELLTKAVTEKALIPEQLPSWEWVKTKREFFAKQSGSALEPFTASQWLEVVKGNLPGFRNDLAHGNYRLHLPHSFSQLELCADLINALFSQSASPATAGK